jgi:uncharacterized protein DUF1543
MKLYMILLGCKPKGRFTEQHDVFFGIGNSLADLVSQMNAFWPEANGILHIDAWREITAVDGYRIAIVSKAADFSNKAQLFFVNLGGYKEEEFDEYHYKVIAVADGLAEAIQQAKSTSFYKHYGFTGAVSHVDDKYGIDIDDSYRVADILSPVIKERYQIEISKSEMLPQEDKLHIGYLPLRKLIAK